MKNPIFSLVLAALLVPGASSATDAPAPKPATAAKRVGRDASTAMDRLQLDPTAITGNRELPKVMSIVPWKPAEPAAGPNRPMGSLIEELLAPVDRDEFRREITYFQDLTSHSPSPQTKPSPGATEP
jgi:hypothetical protein